MLPLCSLGGRCAFGMTAAAAARSLPDPASPPFGLARSVGRPFGQSVARRVQWMDRRPKIERLLNER